MPERNEIYEFCENKQPERALLYCKLEIKAAKQAQHRVNSKEFIENQSSQVSLLMDIC